MYKMVTTSINSEPLVSHADEKENAIKFAIESTKGEFVIQSKVFEPGGVTPIFTATNEKLTKEINN